MGRAEGRAEGLAEGHAETGPDDDTAAGSGRAGALGDRGAAVRDGAAPAAPVSLLQVEVVYCPAPGQVDHSRLALAPGSTLADALAASGVLARHALGTADAPTLPTGIWCRAADPSTPLRDRDRVELYRPLTVDPKEARRLRYQRRAR